MKKLTEKELKKRIHDISKRRGILKMALKSNNQSQSHLLRLKEMNEITPNN